MAVPDHCAKEAQELMETEETKVDPEDIRSTKGVRGGKLSREANELKEAKDRQNTILVRIISTTSTFIHIITCFFSTKRFKELFLVSKIQNLIQSLQI